MLKETWDVSTHLNLYINLSDAFPPSPLHFSRSYGYVLGLNYQHSYQIPSAVDKLKQKPKQTLNDFPGRSPPLRI